MLTETQDQIPDFIPVQPVATAPVSSPAPTPIPAGRGAVPRPKPAPAPSTPDFIPVTTTSAPPPPKDYNPYDAAQFNKPVPKEDAGLWNGFKRLGSSVVHLPGTVWDAFQTPPQNDEEKAILHDAQTKYKGDVADAKLALGFKRLIIDPMRAERALGDRYRQAAAGNTPPPDPDYVNQRQNWQTLTEEGLQPPDFQFNEEQERRIAALDKASNTDLYHTGNMHTLGGNVPVAGPVAAQILDRYQHGDKVGAVFDLVATIGGPKIAEKLGGAVLRGVNTNEIPVVRELLGEKNIHIPAGITDIPAVGRKIAQYTAARKFGLKGGPLTRSATTDQKITDAASRLSGAVRKDGTPILASERGNAIQGDIQDALQPYTASYDIKDKFDQMAKSSEGAVGEPASPEPLAEQPKLETFAITHDGQTHHLADEGVINISPKDFLQNVAKIPRAYVEEELKQRLSSSMNREGLNPATVEDWRQQIRGNNGQLGDPGHIIFDENGNILGADGRHRAMAAVMEGVDRIPIKVFRRITPEEEGIMKGAAFDKNGPAQPTPPGKYLKPEILDEIKQNVPELEKQPEEFQNRFLKNVMDEHPEWTTSAEEEAANAAKAKTPPEHAGEVEPDEEFLPVVPDNLDALIKYAEQSPEDLGRKLVSASPEHAQMYRELMNGLPYASRQNIRGGVIGKLFTDALEPTPGIRPHGTVFDVTQNTRLNAAKFRENLAKMSPEVKNALWGSDNPGSISARVRVHQLENLQQLADVADILQKRAAMSGKIGKVAYRFGIPAEIAAVLSHAIGFSPEGVHLALGAGTGMVVGYRFFSNPFVVGRLSKIANASLHGFDLLQKSGLSGPAMAALLQQNARDAHDIAQIIATQSAVEATSGKEKR